ncbi:8-oxo-dGTP diphosphatase [Microbacterium endophyticum]|uniref:8-oxo-dGTP diphosphatase n=1 Tax=Microbacterium endophyticum TaxID=1526412 RepID=A0A7W4V1C2_9MICO|nr:NUDIX domain-containing protein [Microbacterium endophyticum]MBB2975046.1 8-oxo-dGTP diphosphatase [Microbacterium endophyticum]NIK37414.1 8-oxo-dGTP diphosphatase [Microbacterium endophyticum]
MTATAVYAAGGVVWRLVDGKLRVLLVSREEYRDLSLPKGKVDPGEMLAETAVREIHEETGIRTSLGIPVGVSTYHLPSGRKKIVHYWSAHATDDAIRASDFVPNKEISALTWLSPKKALAQVSYPADVEILEAFLKFVDDGVLETFPIIALRHAKALPRESWAAIDSARPLTARGTRQAESIVGALRAFGIRRIVSSDARRCLDTVAPLAATLGIKVTATPELSQDAWEAGTADPRSVISKRVRSRKAAVLCSHRPVMPDVLNEIAMTTGTVAGSYIGAAAALDLAGFSVAHISATNPGSGIIAIETHVPKD